MNRATTFTRRTAAVLDGMSGTLAWTGTGFQLLAAYRLVASVLIDSARADGLLVAATVAGTGVALAAAGLSLRALSRGWAAKLPPERVERLGTVTVWPAPRCPCCGYDLRATPEKCPECGAPGATQA